MLYAVIGAIRWIDGRPAISDHARRHLGWLLAALALVLGWGLLLEPYELVSGAMGEIGTRQFQLATLTSPALAGTALMVAVVSLLWALRTAAARLNFLLLAGWAVLGIGWILTRIAVGSLLAPGDVALGDMASRRALDAAAFHLESLHDSLALPWPEAGVPPIVAVALADGTARADRRRRFAPHRRRRSRVDHDAGRPSTGVAAPGHRPATAPRRSAPWPTIAPRRPAARSSITRTIPSRRPRRRRCSSFPVTRSIPERLAWSSRTMFVACPLPVCYAGSRSPGRCRSATSWEPRRPTSPSTGPGRRSSGSRRSRRTPSGRQPVPRVDGGRLYWISNGYVADDHFPLSTRASLGGRRIGMLHAAFVGVVEAEEGDTRIFIRGDAGPVADAWARLAAGVVEPWDAIPVTTRAMLPYPAELFLVQSRVLENAETGTLAGRADSLRITPPVSSFFWMPATDAPARTAEYVRGSNGQLQTLLVGTSVEGRLSLAQVEVDSAVALPGPAALEQRWERFATFVQVLDSVRAGGGVLTAGGVRYWLTRRGGGGHRRPATAPGAVAAPR